MLEIEHDTRDQNPQISKYANFDQISRVTRAELPSRVSYSISRDKLEFIASFALYNSFISDASSLNSFCEGKNYIYFQQFFANFREKNIFDKYLVFFYLFPSFTGK